jgi:uncharacterized SAM-binding protein YcdF (DUF218 family)
MRFGFRDGRSILCPQDRVDRRRSYAWDKPNWRRKITSGMLSWFHRLHLFHRRTIWCPTALGTICIAGLFFCPLAWWFNCGESFLSATSRAPSQVLVVEGWIGFEGIRAAKLEFEQRGYQFVVASGGVTAAEGWERGGWSYAEGAQHELIRLGVPKEKIILAPAKDAETQRTYQSAIAVWHALASNGIRPKSVNIFTLGPHARRSRLVFEKAYEPETQVGVIGWEPLSYDSAPWWHSSDRAKQLIVESAGFFYEILLNSGRPSSSLTKS